MYTVIFNELDSYGSQIKVVTEEVAPTNKIVGIIGLADDSFYMAFQKPDQLDRLITALQKAREELTK